MKVLFTTLCLFISLSFYGQVDNQANEGKSDLQRAIELMDNGFPDDAITLLEKAKKENQKDYVYDYEIAFAYDIKKDYKNAIASVERAIKFDNANDQCYQMLGNSYDYLGKHDKAIKAYQRGLKRFPNSGRLYLEQGIVQWNQKNLDAAITLFEQGVKVDPQYPSNYYHLARGYMRTAKKTLAMIYGEQFMNLERNSKRTEEISKLLYDGYKSFISIKSDTINISFDNVIQVSKDGKFFPDSKNSLGLIYEPLLAISVANEKVIDLNSLDRIRTRFLNSYYSEKINEKYPVELFKMNKDILDAGHYEAYNHWLLLKGDEDAFSKWQSANEEKWDKFVEWYNKH